MDKILCTGSASRDTWAVSLCFASSLLMSVETLNPNACQWMGCTVEQSFMLSAGLATLSMFMGAFILMRRLNKS